MTTPDNPRAPGDGLRLLRLLTWLSPAFPTGAFAYSHGLEWATEDGTIQDLETLIPWLDDVLRHGSGRSEAILLRHAFRTRPGDPLRALADQAAALAPSRERAEETANQGAAFARAVLPWRSLPAPIDPDDGLAWPLPIVVGAIFAAAGLDEEDGVLGALHALCASLVSAAIRLVPLGQTDGLRAMAALEATLLRICDESRGAPIEEIGGFCLGADMASLLHETQRTRLFRS